MKKKCRRKHWKLVDPIQYAMKGAEYVSGADLDKIRMMELTSIDAFSKGKATKEDWRNIADMVNISQALADDGIGKNEVTPAIDVAQKALEEAHRRFKEKGVLGLSGLEIQALRDMYEYHDLQRQSVCRSGYEKAIQKVCDCIKSGSKKIKRLV